MDQTLYSHISLSYLDWIIVAVYTSIAVGIAVWSKIGQRDTVEEYFVGGRSMNWLVVSISIFATLFSSISFVAIPGEAYQNGLMFSLYLFGGALATPLAIWMFLRFFFHSPSFTAYEYLEKRYDLSVRLLGAAIFTVLRLIYMGTVYYAVAKLFESLVGWPPMVTVVVVGLITISYTVLGGVKAAVFTDVAQALIIILGIGAILWKVLSLAGYDVFAIYQFAATHGKGYEPLATAHFYGLHWSDRINFFFLIQGVIFSPIINMACDQLTVQRLLASKGYREAKRATLFNAFTSVPIVFMFWMVGIGLFYFYNSGSIRLPAGMTSDHIMGYFINTQLPSPLPGLIVAALLAALMSTISSVVNSCATVIFADGLMRMNIIQKGDPREMLICRSLSVLSGFVGLGIAILLIIGGQGIQSSVLEISGIWSALWSMLLTAFVYGVLAPRVSARAMFIGMSIGCFFSLVLPYALYYAVPAENRIAFSWIGFPGGMLTWIVPMVISLFWPNRKNLRNLTLWTLEKPMASGPAETDDSILMANERK